MEFVDELIKFYATYVASSADAVDILAGIQEKFPEEYKMINDLKDDPTLIEEITSKMSDEVKNAVLLGLLKASSLGRRLNTLFELTAYEKKKLAKELREFAEDIKKDLEKIKRSKTGGG